MAEAIFGFVGVIAGVALSAGFQWWHQRTDRIRAGRVAALILADELTKAMVDIDFFLAASRTVTGERASGVEGAWGEHRAALAAVVEDEEFLKVSFAVNSVHELARTLAAGAGTGIGEPDVEHQREHVREAVELLWKRGGREPLEFNTWQEAQDSQYLPRGNAR